MNWLPAFHLQWLGHVPHGRHHLPTTIVWNSPMQELIGSVMVSSFLLPAFGTLSLLLYFRLPSTFLPSKGKSITTLGTRWYDFFFYYPFRYFINLFYSFHCLSFPFLRDADSRKGTLCPFCVPIHKNIYIYIYLYIFQEYVETCLFTLHESLQANLLEHLPTLPKIPIFRW